MKEASLDMDDIVITLLTIVFQWKAPGRESCGAEPGSTAHLQYHPGPPNCPVRPLDIGTRPESFPTLASRELHSDGTVITRVSVNRGGKKYKR